MSSAPEMAMKLALKLADFILDLVTEEVAHQAITNAAVRRANAIGELADDAKFGPENLPQAGR